MATGWGDATIRRKPPSTAFTWFSHLAQWNDYKLTQLNENGFSISKRTNQQSSWLFAERDSVMNMYGEPVLWAESNQLSGEFIQAFIKNDKVERVHIQRAAMAIQKEDSLYFNQLSGKEIIAYVDSGELRRVNVNGNAETIYYPKDDIDSTIIGINKTENSYVVMHLKNKKAERIVMTSSTTGVMYPLTQLSGGDLYLKNFFWLDKQRPRKSDDVMITFAKETREKIGTSSLMGKGSSGGENTQSAKKTGANSTATTPGGRTTGKQSTTTNTRNMQTVTQ
jgi:hypothetical protein